MEPCIIINRNSFRLHDNPLYSKNTPNYAKTKKTRKTRKTHESRGTHMIHHFNKAPKTGTSIIFYIPSPDKYSPHQYALLLRSVYTHAKAFQKQLCCFLGNEKDFVTSLRHNVKGINRIITDKTNDPFLWRDFDAIMNKEFRMQYISTLTFVDWGNDDISVNKIFEKTKYPQLSSFKKLVHDHVSKKLAQYVSAIIKPVHVSVINPSTHPGWISFEHLSALITQHEKIMNNQNLTQFKFPKLHDTSLETQVDSYIGRTNDMLRSSDWYKPNTRAGSSLYAKQVDIRTTSKCSPLLALGLISPTRAYIAWGGTRPMDSKQGSATDQLLWREFFHAASYIDGFWEADHSVEDIVSDIRQTHKDTIWNSPPYTWDKVNQTDINKWKNGTTGYQDTDTAMCQLKREGWIHHLQRHVVADYLTRGNLNAHWKHGELWFRHTLIDHDAAVNRANWMWLSATAFSSKQKIAHYNHDNYIRRHT